MKLAALTLLLLTLPAVAELPGMPPAAAPESAGGIRGDEPHKTVVITQTAPIRGSLFRQGAAAATPIGPDGQPLNVAPSAPVSFISVQAPAPKKFRKNDIITIVVRQDSQSTSNGKGTSQKQQDFDLALQQMLQMGLSDSGFPGMTNVANPSTLPEIKFKYQNNRQNDASQQRQDSVTTRLSSTVVDVKPNGTLVIQAVARVTVDKEVQVFTLSGVCRAEDIAVDNTILSTQLADLNFNKQTSGEVRDGVRRGWLNKFIDQVNPF